MECIWFKKQMLGKWRRDDGESKKHVSEESMYREIQTLVNDGWHVRIHGSTFARSYEITKIPRQGPLVRTG